MIPEIVAPKAREQTIYCINELYLRNINMMSKLPEFTTQSEKTHVEETKGGGGGGPSPWRLT